MFDGGKIRALVLLAASNGCIVLSALNGIAPQQRLVGDLLARYDKKVRPGRHEHRPVVVTFSMDLYQMIEVVCVYVDNIICILRMNRNNTFCSIRGLSNDGLSKLRAAQSNHMCVLSAIFSTGNRPITIISPNYCCHAMQSGFPTRLYTTRKCMILN